MKTVLITGCSSGYGIAAALEASGPIDVLVNSALVVVFRDESLSLALAQSRERWWVWNRLGNK